MSSDALRGVVGSGPHDLDASADAFALLETIVAARLGRGLCTVVDTLGTDADRRLAWLAAGRAAGLPTVAAWLATPDAECRRRNAARDRPVPAPVLAGQLRAVRDIERALVEEGWDVVHAVSVTTDPAPPPTVPRPATVPERRTSAGVDVILQVSRFPWGEEPAVWLREVAQAADAAGFAGLALMDHLIQIPQVGRAWEPIPEPWVTLGHLAALGSGLRLGTLCTPASFRPAGVIAKAAATLDVLSGGRAFVGVGAGWWEREHAGFGLPFPSDRRAARPARMGARTQRRSSRSTGPTPSGSRQASPMSTSTQSRNTNAFFLQAGLSFGVALLTMIFAICYLPVDPWIRAFLALGTMFLTTSSFTLAKCVRDNQENQAVYARLDQARVDKILAEHDPFRAVS